MQDAFGMNVNQTLDDLFGVCSDFGLCKLHCLLKFGLEVLVIRENYSTRTVLHENVLEIFVLEPVVQVHDVRVRQLLLDFYFVY